jgi:hypothetical protein
MRAKVAAKDQILQVTFATTGSREKPEILISLQKF